MPAFLTVCLFASFALQEMGSGEYKGLRMTIQPKAIDWKKRNVKLEVAFEHKEAMSRWIIYEVEPVILFVYDKDENELMLDAVLVSLGKEFVEGRQKSVKCSIDVQLPVQGELASIAAQFGRSKLRTKSIPLLTNDLSSDGKTLAVGGSIESNVPVLDLESGRVSKIEIKLPRIVSPHFTADGKWLMVAGFEKRPMEKGSIEIWDLEKKERVAAFGKHEKTLGGLAISPDKKTLISGSAFEGFRVWDVPTGKQKFVYFSKDDSRLPRESKPHPLDGSRYRQEYVSSAGTSFLPDGKTFFYVPAGWVRAEVYFHDTLTGQPVNFRDRAKALPNSKKRN